MFHIPYLDVSLFRGEVMAGMILVAYWAYVCAEKRKV